MGVAIKLLTGASDVRVSSSLPMKTYQTKVFNEAYVIQSQRTQRKIGVYVLVSCYENKRSRDRGMHTNTLFVSFRLLFVS